MHRIPGRDASALVDCALPTSLALRETVRRGDTAYRSQAAKDRLYDRMFPVQGGSPRDGSNTYS